MWIPIIIASVILLIPIIMYNSLIGKRNQVRNIFATVDVMLKKRWDLLPNLTNTVKGYMQHERELMESVTKARAAVGNSNMPQNERVAAENIITKAFGQFFATVENYPDLKASDNFMHLQRTLNEIEEQISAARRAYNQAVTDYNTAIQVFPTNILANMMNFQESGLFEIPNIERQNVDIKSHLSE